MDIFYFDQALISGHRAPTFYPMEEQMIKPSFSAPATIAEAESVISRGLTKLRVLAAADPEAMYAMSFLAPSDYHTVVQLEEDGRKKRNTASIRNWNHKSGEVAMYFEERVDGAGSTSSPAGLLANLSKPENASLPEQRNELDECCLALAEAEKQGRPFIALKWFRDTALPQQPFGWAQTPHDRFRVLNEAIARGLVETQALANPKNPDHPTTTLRLNRDKTRGIVGSRFNPIPLRGEPLSSTILRDRG